MTKLNPNKKINGAEALVYALEKQGVEYIFGYSGGAAIPIFDAIITTKTKIKLILVRHEQGAAHIADGYARASGKPGVVLVTSGPGAGNVVTGLMTAHMDSVPLVVISGQQITSMLGLDAFQEADIFNITMPVTKHNYLVKNTDDIPRIVNEAFYLSTSGRPGPVLIDLPKDISSAEINEFNDEITLPAYKVNSSIDQEDLKDIAKAWNESKRPIILAGHGVLISKAQKSLVKIAKKMHTPIITTLLGKGVIDEEDQLSLGMMGMHGTAYANKAIIECDFLLNIGSRFDDRIIGQPDKFCEEAYIAHVDIDSSEENKMINVKKFINADAKSFLKKINPLLRPAEHSNWLKKIDRFKRNFPLNYKKAELSMQLIIDSLYSKTRGQAIVTTDVGQHQMWAAQFFKTRKPDEWISSGGAGTMGFGLPSAIGAQFAEPNKTVISFIGDGGFQMTQFELATAQVNKLPIKIVVLNNQYLGMVRQWQELFYDNRESGVDLEGNPDFAKLAESYGIKAFTIDSLDKVSPVLDEALSYNDGPVLIEAKVIKSSNVFPMIPPGAPLSEMLVSEPKIKLNKPTGST